MPRVGTFSNAVRCGLIYRQEWLAAMEELESMACSVDMVQEHRLLVIARVSDLSTTDDEAPLGYGVERNRLR